MPRVERFPPQPPLEQLIALRKAKFPGMFMRDFADKFLGVTRLHMNNIERGRRRASLELVLRWLDALAPEAKIEMFGDMPVIEERINVMAKLRKVAPQLFNKAA